MEKNKCSEEERYEGKEYGRRDRRISGQTSFGNTLNIVLNWHEFICE
jgi:hypothetical protein